MTSLVPCNVCRRHIRRHETQCRFCGALGSPTAGPFREVVLPRDVKRATLFALGLTLASQACGGQSDGENDPGQSGAGARIGMSTGGTGGGPQGGTGGTNNPFDDPNINLVPPYGAMSPPQPVENGGSGGSGGGGNMGMPDAGPSQDAGKEDAGGSDAAADDAGN